LSAYHQRNATKEDKPSDAILLRGIGNFDIIVADYNMLEMNGAEFTNAFEASKESHNKP
jgi:CheY-like chemotaxis protein